MSFKSKFAGFTLIELMITVAIVGLLASIALPSYRQYVTRGRIPDATTQLSTKRIAMEQFFQDNRTYACGSACPPDDTSTSQYFTFSTLDASNTQTRSATGYTIFARGKGPMTGFTYSVNQSNAKTSTVTGVANWTGNPNCWVMRTGGQC